MSRKQDDDDDDPPRAAADDKEADASVAGSSSNQQNKNRAKEGTTFLGSTKKTLHTAARAVQKGGTKVVASGEKTVRRHLVRGNNKEKAASTTVSPHQDDNDADAPTEPFVSQASYMDDESGTFSSSRSSSQQRGGAIVLGPWMEVLTADTTLFWIFSLSLALYPTVQLDWWNLWQNNNDGNSSSSSAALPFSVVGPWLLFAYATGQIAGQQMAGMHFGMDMLRPRKKLVGSSSTLPLEVTIQRREETILHEQTKNRHKLLMSVLDSTSLVEIRFKNSILKKPRTRPRVWTTLRQARPPSSVSPTPHFLPWQCNVDPCKDVQNSPLVKYLLKQAKVRRKRVSAKIKPSADATLPTDETVSKTSSLHSEMGMFDLSSTPADSLNDCITVEPLFKLRGMDVFIQDEPELDIATHPWLVAHGLRDLPTFTINVMTQWGNILIYFEMPEWVTNFEDLDEKESDPDDVKAAKVR